MFEELIGSKYLTFDRLHSLVLLSEAGSLIEAAGRDHDVASRMSHQLSELAKCFGTRLTMRSGKTLKLTPAGESLAKMARENFLEMQAFRDVAKGAAPAFTIGAGDNLLQWLLVPAIGRMRRDKNIVRLTLCNLPTKPIFERLKDRRIDFGIIRQDAVDGPLECAKIGEQRFALFVPQRLVTSRLLTLKDALLGTPHAAIAGEGQLVERLRDLAESLGGKFVPELICDSMGQCLAAVKSGAFAAVLPVQTWAGAAAQECVVVEDEALEALNRKLVLAWHPKMLEVIGAPADKLLRLLTGALKKAAEDAMTA